ncbi:MAG TPA: hypothetical protein VLA89_15720, partial [Gemmatimonadales bacterium]|nr:hypothetical protein [Gemmatimonadales bacterium]
MDPIRVVVSGSGKMGRQVAQAVHAAPDMELLGFVNSLAGVDNVEGLPVLKEPVGAFAQYGADVVIDFTNADWTPIVAQAALEAKSRLVIGTTGLSSDFTAWLERECLARQLGAVVASNFALGAVLMMHFAQEAARFFDNVEIIELHHDQK